MTIKLLLYCRTYLLAEGLRRLIEEMDDCEVVGLACTETELQDMLRYDTDIVLADTPRCIDKVDKAPVRKPPKVLLINDNGNAALVFDNLKDMVLKGLGGVMASNADSGLLEKAIHKIHSGDLWIDHKTICNSIYQSNDKKHNFTLTKKEKEVLACICSGYTNKKIAQDLCISEQTVKSHCNRLYKKFGVKNRLSLAVNASKNFTGANNADMRLYN